MLSVRIIPTLLHRGLTLVKGVRFNSWRSVGNVMQAAKIYAAREVDELCILNIGATPNNESPDFEMVEKLTEGNFTPITVGGGVKSIDDVSKLLNAGADKIAVCSAVPISDLLETVSARFGSQVIVVSIDIGSITYSNGKKMQTLFVSCGRGHVTYCDLLYPPSQWAKWAEERGAGEILLTSIDQEGTMEGYDLDLIKEVADAVSIPVIAHGGCSGYEDMYSAIKAGASAVAAGALFQFTDCTPKGAAQYLKQKGIEVRI